MDEACDPTHGVPRGVTDTETGSGWWAVRGWGGRVSWGPSFQFGQMEHSGDGGWGRLHGNVNVLHATGLDT